MTDSASARLPERPSVEQLRKQAKDLLHAWREGDASAVERLRAHKPQATHPVLADAQFVLAREHDFESWPKLVQHVQALGRPAHDPRAMRHGLSTTPPFFRIDWTNDTIEPQQPMSGNDWHRLIDVLEETGLTGLNANGQMDDEALARVSRLAHVTRLNLGGCKRLTDSGLQHLARMPQLEELDLSDYPGGQITDRGLEALRHLSELRRFQMCWQRGISDAGASNLSFCDKLERVDLLGSPTGDVAIDALRGKRHLRFLKTGRLVTDAGLRMLRDLPVFKSWRGGEPRYDLMSFGDTEPNFLLLDGPFSDAGLTGLTALEGLFGLGFFRHVSNLTPDGLRFLAELPNLGALGCDGTLCDDTAMRHIAAIPQLRMLMAQGTVASDDGFAALSRSKTIEYIWGRECPNLQGRGFAALADIPALKGLAVSCKRVDDASLASLPLFPALTWLLPMDVSDDGFRHVGRCERLEKLTCMYCRDTGDAATQHIAGLSRLKHYYAGQTQITDRSLESLGRMSSLEEVELSACAGISDAGLVHLARLPRLRKVSVDASARVTRSVIAVFPASVRVEFWT
jgi:hypothetical protein